MAELTDIYKLSNQISENNVIDSKNMFKYRMDIQRYDHNDEQMQFVPNFIQINRRDNRLPDTDLTNIESDLWGISRNLSKIPESRYLGPKKCSKLYNDKGICVCPSCLKSSVVNQNNRESSKKIVKNRAKVTYSDCHTSRTSGTNSNCKNQAYKEDKDMLSMIKGLFF